MDHFSNPNIPRCYQKLMVDVEVLVVESSEEENEGDDRIHDLMPNI
jgi:hypothetical protein